VLDSRQTTLQATHAFVLANERDGAGDREQSDDYPPRVVEQLRSQLQEETSHVDAHDDTQK
jgi:hypothetical protein